MIELYFHFLSSFNPVAPTAMMKVLTRISTVEAGKVKRHPGAGDTFDFHVQPTVCIHICFL